jgi:hypothetical protein
MAKRSKWLVQETKVFHTPVRDTEFAEILAAIGQLIYDRLCSQPDSFKSIDTPLQPDGCEIASHNTKKGCL